VVPLVRDHFADLFGGVVGAGVFQPVGEGDDDHLAGSFGFGGRGSLLPH